MQRSLIIILATLVLGSCVSEDPIGSTNNIHTCADTSQQAGDVSPKVDTKPKCVPHTEICNGKDDDCDGETDEGLTVMVYEDKDQDGFGNPNEAKKICMYDTEARKGFVGNAKDCNDLSNWDYPGHTEYCDGSDNNCNGVVDEHCDDDGDGYCNPTMQYSNSSFCIPSDCNDKKDSIHPSAEELCGDGIDNNCNGYVDEGCK